MSELVWVLQDAQRRSLHVGPLYVARCVKASHVVSPYSGGIAECVLGCNLWYAYAVCEK